MIEKDIELSWKLFLLKCKDSALYLVFFFTFCIVEFSLIVMNIDFYLAFFPKTGIVLSFASVIMALIITIIFYWFTAITTFVDNKKALNIAFLTFLKAPVYSIFCVIWTILISILLLFSGIGLILIPLGITISLRSAAEPIINDYHLEEFPLSKPAPLKNILKPWQDHHHE